MADLETRVDNLDERVTSLERQVSETTTNMNNLIIAELRDFKAEMRDRDNQRAAEIRDLRNEIRTGLDGMGKHVHNLAITSMAAIGAMVVTVIISIFKS